MVLQTSTGRGSCTASQVLLELILNEKAPRAIVMRDLDGLAALGSLIAQKVFQVSSIHVVVVGDDGFNQLVTPSSSNPLLFGVVTDEGTILTGNNKSDCVKEIQKHKPDGNTNDENFFVLNSQEQSMISKCKNDAQRMALEVVFQYAHMTNSVGEERKYVPVSKAHIDGCTYIGPGGLAFAQRLVRNGGKVAVPTTLNSMSTDRRRWDELGVPEDYAKNAIDLGNAYLELGCQHSFTCAPYLLPDPPELGEDLVWGESNAVVYANSVLGARTEKYADYLDICCAIAGFVPATGMHLVQNRHPKIILEGNDLIDELIDMDVDLDVFFPVLGHLCGSLSDGKVPLITGLNRLRQSPTDDQMKAFCAAFGTTAASPLVHVAGVTAEAKDQEKVVSWLHSCENVVKLTMDELFSTFSVLDGRRQSEEDSINLVALGNPHLSVTECQRLCEMVQGREKHPEVRVVACLSREIHKQADQLGFIHGMKSFGVELVNDTCWCMLLNEPLIPKSKDAIILTNSGKYAHYGPGLTSRRFRFGSTQDCVTAAVSGRYQPASNSLGTGLRKINRRSYSSQSAVNVARQAMKYARRFR